MSSNLPPPTSIRSRQVCMANQDWQEFSDALAATWPEARYYLVPPSWTTTLRKPPPIILTSRLMDLALWGLQRIAMMIFDTEWQPNVPSKTHPAAGGSRVSQRARKPLELPYVRFTSMSREYIDNGVPRIGRTEMDFYAESANKEHASLRGKFFRLHSKFATNRRGLVLVDPALPLEERARNAKPIPKTGDAMWWCGLHAIEWARQDPKRLLLGNMWPDPAGMPPRRR